MYFRIPEKTLVLNKKIVFALAVCLSACYTLSAQKNSRIDSLLKAVKKTSHDTSQGMLYEALSYEYLAQDKLTQAMQFARQSLSAYQKARHSRGMGVALNRMANIYDKIGNYEKSIESYVRASIHAKESKNEYLVAYAFNGLGIVYMEQKDFGRSLANYRKALQIYEKAGEKSKRGNVLNNIGENYLGQMKYDSALFYFEKAKNIWYQLKEERWMASTMTNIGTTFAKQGKTNAAFGYLTQALRIQERLGEDLDKIYTFYGIATLYLRDSNYPLANVNAQKSMMLAKKLNIKIMIRDAAKLMADINVAQGNFRLAYIYQRTFIAYQDSLINQEKIRSINRLQLLRQEAENETLRKQNVVKETELNKSLAENRWQSTLVAAIAVALVLTSLYALFFFLGRQKQKKLNALLSEKNLEIEKIAADLRHAHAEVMTLSEGLEIKVFERTKRLEIQNLQMRKYAFYNAHKLRGPLARILGLAYIMQIDENADTIDLMKKIEISAAEMDDVVREINEILTQKTEL
ncbi:MAG: tetratricopeptide repeat protein [Verrucomicrobia bacterium]|nr:tetratricopeptide repeat protein [Cytophagales bacterium]